MVDIPKLWCFHKGSRSKYFIVGPVDCNGCNENIVFGNLAYHLLDWNPKNSGEYIFCETCIKKGMMPKGPLPPIWYSQERRISVVVDGVEGLPPQSFPVQIVYHGLSNSSNISTFDAARSNKGIISDTTGSQVIDKTVLAGRSDSTFLDDNAPVLLGADVHELIEEKDKSLSVDDGLSLLDDLSTMKPVLTEQKKKQLEDKR